MNCLLGAVTGFDVSIYLCLVKKNKNVWTYKVFDSKAVHILYKKMSLQTWFLNQDIPKIYIFVVIHDDKVSKYSFFSFGKYHLVPGL